MGEEVSVNYDHDDYDDDNYDTDDDDDDDDGLKMYHCCLNS